MGRPRGGIERRRSLNGSAHRTGVRRTFGDLVWLGTDLERRGLKESLADSAAHDVVAELHEQHGDHDEEDHAYEP